VRTRYVVGFSTGGIGTKITVTVNNLKTNASCNDAMSSGAGHACKQAGRSHGMHAVNRTRLVLHDVVWIGFQTSVSIRRDDRLPVHTGLQYLVIRRSSSNPSFFPMPSSKSSSSASSSSSNVIWETACDGDDPLRVAVLHASLSTTTNNDNDVIGCGHSFRWQPGAILTLHECPTCHKPVKFICNAAAAAAATKTAANTNSNNSLLLFKYGKLVFRLSAGAALVPDTSILQTTTTTTSTGPLGSWWRNLLSRIVSDGNDHHHHHHHDQEVPAFLAQVLGLESELFKILHKGKVLYPPPPPSLVVASGQSQSQQSENKDDTTTTTTSSRTMTLLSQRLLEISQQDDETSNASRAGIYKPTLMVMGTRKDQQLKEPSTTTAATTTAASITTTAFTLLRFPFQVVYWTFYGSWWLVRSFVEPFLPNWVANHHRRPHND
jgi:hypothetical protein